MRENRKKMKENVQSTRNMRSKFQAIVHARIADAGDVKKEIRRVNAEIIAYKRKRRVRESANIDVDFVSLNVDQAESFAATQVYNQEHNKKIHNERLQRYKLNREVDAEAKLRYNVLSLSKWDFLRVKRAEYEGEIGERIRNRQ